MGFEPLGRWVKGGQIRAFHLFQEEFTHGPQKRCLPAQWHQRPESVNQERTSKAQRLQFHLSTPDHCRGERDLEEGGGRQAAKE